MRKYVIDGDTPTKLSEVIYPIVLFTGSTDFVVKYDGTASIPGDVKDGTSSEFNPVARYIPDGCQRISIAAGATAIVTAAFYG